MKKRNEETEWKSGIEKGKLKEKIEVAKKMKEKQIKLEDIKEITGLTIEEIEKL